MPTQDIKNLQDRVAIQEDEMLSLTARMEELQKTIESCQHTAEACKDTIDTHMKDFGEFVDLFKGLKYGMQFFSFMEKALSLIVKLGLVVGTGWLIIKSLWEFPPSSS